MLSHRSLTPMIAEIKSSAAVIRKCISLIRDCHHICIMSWIIFQKLFTCARLHNTNPLKNKTGTRDAVMAISQDKEKAAAKGVDDAVATVYLFVLPI